MLENVGPLRGASGATNPKQNSRILWDTEESFGSTVLWLRYTLKYVQALFRDSFKGYI
jgi:hypothetical protein